MNNALPDYFVAEGLELAKEALFLGKPMMDLTREEAIAVAAKGWKAEAAAREQAKHDRDFIFSCFVR